MANTKRTWIIGIGGSDVDGVVFGQFFGTEAQVKKKLVELIRADKKEDKGSWDFGTESQKELQTDERGIYGYNCFSNYHIDYQAKPLGDIRCI